MYANAQSAPSGATTNFDHLRWIAALAVVFQHARALVMVDYAPGSGAVAKLVFFAAGFAHQAVIIFFVLSGYLVGGKAVRMVLEGSLPLQRRRFLLDRFSRVAIVLWPALILAAIVARVAPLSPVMITAGWSADLPNITLATQPIQWWAAGLMLNEILTPTIAYNGALWSLAYEWTYYLVAAAAIFVVARDRTPVSIAVILYGVALAMLAAFLHPQLIWMLCFWLAGAIASRAVSWQRPLVSVLLFAATIIISRFLQPAAYVDAAVAVATAILLADQSFRSGRVAPRAGPALASFSFSLYAIHWPIMLLMVAFAQSYGFMPQRLPAGPSGYAAILSLVVVAYAIATLFAFCTEWRTAMARDWLLRIVSHVRTTKQHPVSEW